LTLPVRRNGGELWGQQKKTIEGRERDRADQRRKGDSIKDGKMRDLLFEERFPWWG